MLSWRGTPGTPNIIVNAGVTSRVHWLGAVPLEGSYIDPEASGTTYTHQWSQTEGTPVVIANPAQLNASFQADPANDLGEPLIFQLMTTASDGDYGTDLVTIKVNPVITIGSVSSVKQSRVDRVLVELNGTADSPTVANQGWFWGINGAGFNILNPADSGDFAENTLELGLGFNQLPSTAYNVSYNSAVGGLQSGHFGMGDVLNYNVTPWNVSSGVYPTPHVPASGNNIIEAMIAFAGGFTVSADFEINSVLSSGTLASIYTGTDSILLEVVAGQVSLSVIVGGVLQHSITSPGVSAGVRHKAFARIHEDDIALMVNGVLIAHSTATALVPTVNTLNIGHDNTTARLDGSLHSYSVNTSNTPLQEVASQVVGDDYAAAKGIAWSKDGKYVAFTSHHQHSIEVAKFDRGILTRIVRIKDIARFAGCNHVSWSDTGNFLAVTSQFSQSLEVLEFTGTDLISRARQTGADLLDVTTCEWDPTGTYIATSSLTPNAVEVMEFVTNNSLVRRARVTNVIGARGLDWNLAGTHLVVSAFSSDSVHVLEFVTNNSLVSRAVVAGADYNNTKSVAWNPEGTHIAISSEDALEIMEFTGTALTRTDRLVDVIFSPQAVAWSNDGNYVATDAVGGMRTYQHKNGTLTLFKELLLPELGGLHWIAWSRDDKYIATASAVGHSVVILK